MNYYNTPEFDEYWQRLIDESVNIKWIINQHGGNACKSNVEDVLMLRYPDVTRYDAHEAQNHIEAYNLDKSSFLRRAWQLERPEPVLSDYPEMQEATRIKWFKGSPYKVTL